MNPQEVKSTVIFQLNYNIEKLKVIVGEIAHKTTERNDFVLQLSVALKNLKMLKNEAPIVILSEFKFFKENSLFYKQRITDLTKHIDVLGKEKIKFEGEVKHLNLALNKITMEESANGQVINF